MIIRKGYLVAEWYGVPTMPTTTFRWLVLHQVVNGIAFGCWMTARNHKLPHDAQINLDTPIIICQKGFPLTDPEKKKVQTAAHTFHNIRRRGEDHGMIRP